MDLFDLLQIGNQQGKQVVAQMAEQIGLADGQAQLLGNLLQQAFPLLMADGVAQLAKAIDLQQDQRLFIGVTLQGGQVASDFEHETIPIGQAGQGVIEAALLQLDGLLLQQPFPVCQLLRERLDTVREPAEFVTTGGELFGFERIWFCH